MAQYTVLLDPHRTSIAVFKNTGDPETPANWVMQDEAIPVEPHRQFTPRIRSAWAEQLGTNIHVATAQDGGRVAYHVFSTSTDLWTTIDEWVDQGDDSSGVFPEGLEVGCSVVVRSDGDVIVLYTGFGTTAATRRVMYSRREAGSWTRGVVVTAQATDDTLAGVIVKSVFSDRAFFIYTNVTDVDILIRSLNSSNVLDTEQVAAATPVTSTERPYGPGTHYLSVETRMRVPFRNSAGDLLVIEWDSNPTPTITATTVITSVNDPESAGGQLLAAIDVDDKNLHAVWSNDADLDIFRDENDDDGGWGTDTEQVDAVTANALSIGIYTRSGEKLGIMYDDAGTIKFEEVDIGAGGTAFFRTNVETIDFADALILQGQKLLGEAVGVADARTVSVSTTRGEAVTVGDALVKSVGKLLTEGFSVVDVLATAKTTARLLVETITVADVLIRRGRKLLGENLSVADDLGFFVGFGLTESISISDANPKKAAKDAFAEAFSTSDGLTITAGKELTETVSIVDVLVRVGGKLLTETISISDDLTILVGKLLTEGIGFADVVTVRKVLLKLLVETITVADDLGFLVGKLLTEGISASDALTKAGSTTRTEGVSVVDGLTIKAGKLLTEGISVVDVLATAKGTAQLLVETISLADDLGFFVGKLLTEGIGVADDVTKSASTTRSESPSFADSLTKRAGKLLTEGVGFADVVSVRKVLLKLLVETINVADALTKKAGKLLTEGTSFSDAVTKAVATTLAESPTFSDAVTKQVATLFAEGVTVTDALARSGGKDLTESVGVADGLTKKVGKDLPEAVGIVDGLVKLVGKILTETITVVDVLGTVFTPAGGTNFPITLFETVSFADVVEKRVGKLLVEGLTALDVLIRSTGKDLQESPSVADAVTKSVSTTRSETITFSDAVTSSTGKTFVEGISIADTLAKSAGLILVETLTVSDGVTKFVSKLFVEGISIVDLLTTFPAAQAVPIRILTFALRTEAIVASAISGVRIESIPSSLLKIDPNAS